ncbi:MAG: FixH family protein [Kofleriaceae bacterium]
MRTTSMLRHLALVAALGCAGACAGDDTHGDDTTYNCAVDDRGEAFTANMTRTGPGGLTFTIVSATPALPIRGDNVWVVDVAQGGSPVTDAAVKLTPFMPDHRHGSGKVPVWTPDPQTPGRFTVSDINLWMPGVWELTFEATPTGGVRDSVLFTFCLTG